MNLQQGSAVTITKDRFAELDVPLERDGFCRDLIRHLSGTLEDVVGLEEASGFVSVVGQRMGDEIDRAYRLALATDRFSREQVARVLADLKHRIQGDFYVVEEDEQKIVLASRSCPFGDKVHGRESLCMMTSNVFGRITAEHLGYAKVSIEQAISRGDAGCRVVVYLTPDGPGAAADGNEYLKR